MMPTDWRLIGGSGAAAPTCEGVNLCNGEDALKAMGTQHEMNMDECWLMDAMECNVIPALAGLYQGNSVSKATETIGSRRRVPT